MQQSIHFRLARPSSHSAAKLKRIGIAHSRPLFDIYRVPKKKLSLVEIGCGKYITVVTSPFSIVLELIYPRHSPGGPGHSIGEVGGAHGGRQGHQGGHKERL